MTNTKTAATILQNDGVIILPTDTIYGFSCHPDSVKAVDIIRDFKNRDNKPFLLLDNNLERIKKYFSQEIKLQKFINDLIDFKIWPDNLTLVAEKNSACNYPFLSEFSTIGVRFCTYPVVAEICNLINSGVTSTSINLSGQKELTDLSDIQQVWQNKVDLIIPAIKDYPTSGSSSAIILFDSVSGKFNILRAGSVETMSKLKIFNNVLSV